MRIRIAIALSAVVMFAAVALAVTGCAGPSTAPTMSAGPDATGLIAPSATLGLQWVEGTGDAVFTQSAEGTGRQRLIGGPADAFHPDWSPDGSWVAYRTADAGTDQIWIAQSDGSGARVLADCAEPCFGADFPAWSPDSTSVAYTAYDAPVSADLPPSGSSLHVIDVQSGVDTSVLSSEPGQILDNARWSPDGSMLAFQIDHFESSGAETALEIAVAPSAGGDIRRITDGAMFGGYPDWNPVDGRIVFCTYDLGPFETLPSGARSDLYTVEADGTGLTALTDSSSTGVRLTQPSWTADGLAVLATQVDPAGKRSIAIVPGEGGEPITLPGDGGTHVRQIPG